MLTPVEIDFISKLANSLKNSTKKLNLAFKWNIGLGVFLVFLTTNLISMDNTITVQWMNLTIENSYLIFLFSIIVFFAHQNCASLMIDNFQLGNRVKSIYKTCIKDSNIFTIEDSDYLTNDILSSFISEKLFSSHRIGKFYYSLNLFFSMAVIFFLPLVAEVLAFINLTQTFGYAWWLLLIFIFIVLFEVIIVISLLKQLFS